MKPEVTYPQGIPKEWSLRLGLPPGPQGGLQAMFHQLVLRKLGKGYKENFNQSDWSQMFPFSQANI